MSGIGGWAWLGLDAALAGLLPGLLALHAIGLPASRAERLLLTIPASLAVVALATVLLGVAGLPPGRLEITVLDAILALAAWHCGAPHNGERIGRAALLAAAAPALLLVAVTAAAMHGLTTLPGQDALIHAEAVRWFTDGHAAPPLIQQPLDGIAVPETRYGWQAWATALTQGSGMPVDRVLTYGAWWMLVALPGACTLLVRRLGVGWRPALASGAATLAVGIVPFQPLTLGQVPLLAGAFLLAPVAAVATIDLLRAPGPRTAALAMVLTGGVAVAHPSDLPTWVLLVATLAVALGLPLRRLTRRHLWVPAALAPAALLAYRAVTTGGEVLAGVPVGHQAISSIVADNVFGPRRFDGFFSTIATSLGGDQHDFLLPLLALTALALGWRLPAVRALAALGAGLLVLQIDAWGWQWPWTLVFHTYPWSAPERLVYLDWFVLAPLAGVGAWLLTNRLVSLAHDNAVRDRVLAMGAALAAVPVLMQGSTLLGYGADAMATLTPADRTAIASVDQVVPVDAVVLTDGTTDGGAWLRLVGDRRTLLNKDWAQSSAATQVRAALSGLCSPGAPARLRALGVGYVYLGPLRYQGQGVADRSCGSAGTAGLTPVLLPDTGPAGPWLLRLDGTIG